MVLPEMDLTAPEPAAPPPVSYPGLSEEDIATAGEVPAAAPSVADVEKLAATTPAIGGMPPAPQGESAISAMMGLTRGDRPVASAGSATDRPREYDEVEAARRADADARHDDMMALAGRQLVAGITRTPVGEGLAPAPSEVPAAQAAVKSRQQKVAQAAERARQARLDDSRIALEGAQTERTLRPTPAPKSADLTEYPRELVRLRDEDQGLREKETERKSKLRPKGQKLKDLTDSTITELSDTDSAIASLEGLGQKFKDLGQEGVLAKASGKVSAALGLTSTDAGQYQAAAKLAMQGIGKIMEGGKLAAGDEVKYTAMLPVPGDSYESAAKKISAATAYLRKLRDDRVSALKAAGRNVPEFGKSAGAAAEETKQVGGVTYVKRNGQWFKKG
jgi:hypothetical protein